KGKDAKLTNARHQRAILISSGFIAGAALFGVLGALVIFITGNTNALNFGVWTDPDGVGAQITALVAFTALVLFFVWETKRAKVDD
ncbi:MAG: peptide transporter, partial [Fermentimonas sp.]|nr:peptide transporter [Fermentimonas sp.]